MLGFRVVAREADEYAELSRGETTLQLATDSAPYWASERPRLLPPGQRGSGVEIVLLVENVDAVYRQAQQAQADIVRELADYPWHMRQFWVRHPDGYLIRPAQKILSVNPATYRRQVADAFGRDTPRITQELLAVKQTADRLAQQGDFLGAATIYETLVTEIFEQSHLYYDEEAEYDDYYEEEWYFPEEEGLEKLRQGSVLKRWATVWLTNGLIGSRVRRASRCCLPSTSVTCMPTTATALIPAQRTSSSDTQRRWNDKRSRSGFARVLTDEEQKVTGSQRKPMAGSCWTWRKRASTMKPTCASAARLVAPLT